MLDIKHIRKNKDQVIKSLKRRNINSEKIEEILLLDKQRREIIQKVENIKADKNTFNKEISKLSDKEKVEKIKLMANLVKEEEKLSDKLNNINNTFKKILLGLPNYPADDVIEGASDKDNKEIKVIGEKTKFDFKPKSYIELAKIHDLIDTERAAKISGSRFGFLKNEGALLWNALIQYSLDILLKDKFIPFYSPSLVKKEIMEDSGYDTYIDGQDAYYIEKDKLFLVGTGEHALLPYHRDEILDEDQLPLNYTTYSSCYRREAGSYGKDTKGILRVHQFDKQEMLIICQPKDSWSEFDHLLKLQEKIIQGLKLPYHLLSVCAGDLPKPSARVIDLECWIPSENKYRETHSASNCTDFQARRNNIRYKGNNGQTNFVHILNATVITPRTLISLLENYQQKDGSIAIPKVLLPFMHGVKKIQNK